MQIHEEEKKSVVISVRVPLSVKEKLDTESALNNISVNTMISQTLKKHVEWNRFAANIGFVFLTRGFLRAMLNSVDDSDITRIATTTCRSAMRDAVIFIKGEETLENFIETLDLWLAASNIPFRHITGNGTSKYVIQHELGMKWSTYFSSMLKSMVNELGYCLSNPTLNEQTVSFEIIKIAK
jgi:hypothetical protein